MADMKHLFVGGSITKAIGEQRTRNGVPVGIVEGYLASWKMEDGPYPDRIVRGAFKQSLADHRKRGNRPIRMNYMHERNPIGGFPIETAKEDERGLYAVGEINLDRALGREVYSLAQQGVVTDFSVGITAEDREFEKLPDGRDCRVIKRCTLFEASLVDEPMNRDAQVVAVKSAMPFANLPTAPEEHVWDAEAAKERVLGMCLKDGDPTAAFLDRGRRFQIADLIDGQLCAVPGAVAAAAEVVKSERIEDHELLTHLDRYCGRMGLPSPFEAAPEVYRFEQVKAWTARDLEAALAETGRFSRSATKFLASKIGGAGDEVPESVWSDVLASLTAMREEMKSRA